MKIRYINLLGVTIGCLICIPLVRYISKDPFEWRFCISFCGTMWVMVAPVLYLLGVWEDHLHDEFKQRHQYNGDTKDRR